MDWESQVFVSDIKELLGLDSLFHNINAVDLHVF